MIIVLERGAKPEQIAEVADALRAKGMQVQEFRAGGKPALHVQSGPARRARRVQALDVVEGLVATSGPRIRREGHRFFPYHFLQWAAIGIVVLAVLVLYAGQLPPGVGRPIDLQTPPSEAHVPWFARAPLAFLALFPPSLAWLAWLFMLGAMALFLAIPRLDRSRDPGLGSRLPVLGAVAVAFAFVAYLALKGTP